MSTIITKFSDYVIHSIEFFISSIQTELGYRDLSGLTKGRIEMINITKEHPLVSLMASQLSEVRNADALRASIIPAISVTPGTMTEDGFAMGKSPKSETVDDDFIDTLKAWLEKDEKTINNDLLITKNQIETIIGEYNRADTGAIRLQENQWSKNEEINISVWSDNTDIDILLGNLMDSIFTSIQVGFIGDDSQLRNMQYKINKGLTNFNFGRVLYGTEYNLTFLNTFSNYIIYTDPKLSGHDLNGTFLVPGETE